MSFTTEKTAQKLALLNNTQQSIQTTSQWCLFHYRHAQPIVALWKSSFITPSSTIDQSECNYRLALFYLCNDIIQFSKKKEEKYSIFLVEFKKFMPEIMMNISGDNTNIHLKDKYARVLSVWRDRNIYPLDFISKLERLLNKSASPASTATSNNQQLQPEINDNSIHVQQNITHPADFIPVELQQIVTKYNRLNQLHKSYKANFTNFNKISESILNHDDSSNVSKQEEKSQLSNILSSLSALQKLTPGANNNSNNTTHNTSHNNTHNDDQDDQELKKIGNIENLAIQIENQSYEITNIRSELSKELSKLSSELDDWISLDRTKQLKLQSVLKNIDEKKKTIIDERDKVAVFNYGADNDNDEIIPKYDDYDNNSDSDIDIRKNSDDDSDGASDNEIDTEETNKVVELAKPVSALHKRLLGEKSDDVTADAGDQDGNKESDRKRVKKDGTGNTKSVSFAEVPETRVFDKDESIESVSAPEIALAEEDSDLALKNILGMLQ